MAEGEGRGVRQPLKRLTTGGRDIEAGFRMEAIFREVLVLSLTGSCFGLLGLALAASYWRFVVLPIALGELMTGLYLFLLQHGRGKTGMKPGPCFCWQRGRF